MIGSRGTAVAALEDLLARQHRALLAGDLTSLEGMDTALERAFGRLGRDGADRDALRRLRTSAARNADLIRAAQAGVAQARASLRAARSVPLSTYDASGRARPTAPAPSRLLARG